MPGDEDCKKDMTPVDLSLAINYLPAVACLTKTLLITSSLAIVNSEHSLGAFTIIALMLNVDKVCSSERIFNGNSVMYMILLSWFLNYLRQGMQSAPAAAGVICVMWMLFSLVMLMEPNQLRGYLSLDPSPRFGWGETAQVDVRPGRFQASRYVPTVVNTVCVGAVSFVHMESEPGWLKVCRSIGFAMLCVTWVYLVGVWQRCGSSQQQLFTQNMLGRFCPVLFVYPVFTIPYFLLSVLGLVCLYVDIHGGGLRLSLLSYYGLTPLTGGARDEPRERCHEYGEQRQDARGSWEHSADGLRERAEIDADSSNMVSLNMINTSIEEETEEELEAYFRSACQERRGSAAV